MKPIKLSLQAFGPFADQQEVDFAKLGDNPLFLINGPTGAGKTSILDAICFALYGQTTGNERDGSQMRCDHAEDSVLTEVSLEFALANKRFLIRRVPVQTRAKSRGEGTTIQPAEAQLRELDGTDDGRLIVSKSVSDANDEIKQLIGLGVDQFRQVMVLPQGKFRELLLADSKDREAIFSKLFATHIYKKIENSLKDKASGIQKAVEHHQSEMKGILQGAEVHSKEELDEELAALQPQLSDAAELKDQAQEEQKLAQRNNDQAITLNARFGELATKQTELANKLATVSDIETKQLLLNQSMQAQGIYHVYTSQRSEAEKLAQVSQHNKQCNSSLIEAKQQHGQAAEQLAQAKLAATVLDGLKVEQVALQRHEQHMIELVSARANLRLKTDITSKSQGSLHKKQQELASLEQELVEKEQVLVGFAKKVETLIPEQQALAILGEKLSAREMLEKVRADIQLTEMQKLQSEKQVESKNIAFEDAKQKATKTEMAWHSGQAALLAKELQEDQPCPVCGSKEHPNLAQTSSQSKLVSKQQVTTARTIETQAREILQSTKDGLTNITGQLTLLESKQTTFEQGLGQYAEQTIEALKQQQLAVQSSVNELVNLKSKKQELDDRVAQIKSIQTSNRQTLSSLETQVATDSGLLIQAQTTVLQTERQVPEQFREADVLVKAIGENAANIKALTKQLNDAEQLIANKQSTLDKALSKQQTVLSQLTNQEALTTIANSEWQAALEQSDFESVESFLNARLDDGKLSSLKNEADNYHSSIASLTAVIQQLEGELAAKQPANLDLMQQQLIEKTQLYKHKDNVWREFEARSKSLSSVKEKLLKALAANELLNKQYAIFGTLNNVANGATGNKISLQRFVLSVLLDDVLIQASHRLHIMSKGRYQLVRKEDRAKGNKASGLELEVEDGDTGKPRSVATLSGGESFMAALSLALGLSDVVQSYAGGIKLDALFIDEGFGSLDQESLDAAIQVLIDLQATGRMIGIISHVTELKDQMALRLDVSSGKLGSSIATIAG